MHLKVQLIANTTSFSRRNPCSETTFSSSENTLKFTYSNVDFQDFHRGGCSIYCPILNITSLNAMPWIRSEITKLYECNSPFIHPFTFTHELIRLVFHVHVYSSAIRSDAPPSKKIPWYWPTRLIIHDICELEVWQGDDVWIERLEAEKTRQVTFWMRRKTSVWPFS